MTNLTVSELAKMFDHSLLQPTLTDADLDRGFEVAKQYHVASVCVKPYGVKCAADALRGSGVLVGTVIGFPHGGHTTRVKLFEAKAAMDDGAVELDMVVNVGKVLTGNYAYVSDEIAAIVEEAHRNRCMVKVIFENCFLQDEHKIRLCEICAAARADWVKTSTGYGDSGATDHDLRAHAEHSPPHVQVKAAGGVRTFDRVLAVRALGVSRIGATATKAILDECRQRLERK